MHFHIGHVFALIAEGGKWLIIVIALFMVLAVCGVKMGPKNPNPLFQSERPPSAGAEEFRAAQAEMARQAEDQADRAQRIRDRKAGIVERNPRSKE